jgi:hypothetical protein
VCIRIFMSCQAQDIGARIYSFSVSTKIKLCGNYVASDSEYI